MLRYLYIVLGTISLSLGILGIITPMLPTTPFILLTGVLYGKSSPRLHQKLLQNKVTGYYLKRLDTGVSWRTRLFLLALMWTMVSITAFGVLDYGTKRFIVLALGVIGTIAQLIVLGKQKKPKPVVLDIQVENDEN